jgi:cytoskeletal protein CcmA (bactofilin family)
MSQGEDRKREGRFGSLTGALRRRQVDKIEVKEYLVGDIRAENAVEVLSDGLVVGDILAPEVVVVGLVYGYVACRHLTVAPGGQIWGDVYISSLELAPSGKINGWVCTLDSGTVDLLRAGELGKGDLPDQGERRLPTELAKRIQLSGADVEADQSKSQRRSGIWRQLRSEAALALIARSEIEAGFDQRLAEAISDRTSTSTELEVQSQTVPEMASESAADGSSVAGELASSEVSHTDAVHEEAEVVKLQAQLQQATAAARKYYGELLWTRAELRAARREDGGE